MPKNTQTTVVPKHNCLFWSSQPGLTLQRFDVFACWAAKRPLGKCAKITFWAAYGTICVANFARQLAYVRARVRTIYAHCKLNGGNYTEFILPSMHSNVNCLLQTFHFQHFRGAGCTDFQGHPVHCKMGKITSLQTAHWILQHSVKLPISQAHTAQGFRPSVWIGDPL